MDAQKTYQTTKKKQIFTLIGLCIAVAALIGLGLWQFYANIGGCRGPNYWGEYWSLTDFMFDPFSFGPGLMIDTGLVLALCTFIWFKIASNAAKIKFESQSAQEQKEQAAREAKQKRQELLASGAWEFPVVDFVSRCKKAGVTDLDSAFYVSKAMKIAATILSEHNIDIEYHKLYVSENLIKSHWKNGSRRIHLDEEEKARAEEERRRTPQTAVPNEEESESIRAAKQILNQTGIQKRQAILEKKLNDLRQEINKKEEGAKALRDLGGIIASSAYQEKPKDWATLGGIASGIAGPGAGAAVAVNAMVENERIEARNAQNRAAVARMSLDMNRNAMSVEEAIPDLRRNADLVRTELYALDEKVVLAVASKELEKSLKCVSFNVKKSKTEVLEITASIRNSYVPDVPDGVKITIDGVIVVDVLCDGIHIDEAYLPLPLYGIECGKTDKVYGYCTKYMIGNREYTLSVRSMNVWAMEL